MICRIGLKLANFDVLFELSGALANQAGIGDGDQLYGPGLLDRLDQ